MSSQQDAMTPVQTELLLQVNGTQAAFGIEFVRSRRQICIAGSSAQAGIPAFKYNLSLLGVLRTATTLGRGGAC